MIYNLLRNALLAWLLHAAASFVLDAGGDARARVAQIPVQSCTMPIATAAAVSFPATTNIAGARS